MGSAGFQKPKYLDNAFRQSLLRDSPFAESVGAHSQWWDGDVLCASGHRSLGLMSAELV